MSQPSPRAARRMDDNRGDTLVYDLRRDADADAAMYAENGHEVTPILPTPDGRWTFDVYDLWNPDDVVWL